MQFATVWRKSLRKRTHPMTTERNAWSSVSGGILALLILVVPVLAGYDIYLQWGSPTLDFYLDRPGSSTVHSVIPGGEAEAAGLQAGDVILTVDDTPFRLWHA